VIPILHNKNNLIASSETGSGKTLSYLIPVIHNCFLNKLKGIENCKALIILPTKELCIQIYHEAMIFANYYTENEIGVKYLTKSMLNSIQGEGHINFINNNDILIATPTKILEFLEMENSYIISKLQYLILDEADKFFDLGFIEIIDKVLNLVSHENHICKAFLSATLVEEIEEVITNHILHPCKVSIGSNKVPARSVNQKFIYCTNEEGKLIGLRNLIKSGFEPPMLIFIEGREKLKSIYKSIKFDVPKTEFLHSKMSKKEREEVVKRFRSGEIWILLCTDLLSRGIDFKNVKSVLNYDCPYNPVNYIHRIGRTGRAGKTGNSYTFIVDSDISKLKSMSTMLNNSLKHGNLDCPNWILNLAHKKK
jgi:ATP-dependent RNA helicase DDX52/ROK1